MVYKATWERCNAHQQHKVWLLYKTLFCISNEKKVTKEIRGGETLYRNSKQFAI